MTRVEIIKLLKMLRAAYPNVKIADAEGTVAVWELAFGADEAETIYKAARWHINTCKYFPTPADIRAGMRRGELLYGNIAQAPTRAIEAPNKPVSVACVGSCVCPYFEGELCFGTAAEMALCSL